MSQSSSSSASSGSPTVTVHSPTGDTFVLRSMLMTESLGRPFRIELELQCESFDVNLDSLLGKGMSVGMSIGGGTRFFHGVVAQIEMAQPVGRWAVYKAELMAWPWLLTRTNDCRIFQAKSVPDIIKQGIFREHGQTHFADKLKGSYAARDYCVQYRESDFNFVSRLMEEEGIYYYFTHAQDKHTLQLSDAMLCHDAASGYEQITYKAGESANYEREVISQWREVRQFETFGYEHTNFDFEKPRTSLKAAATLKAGTNDAKMHVYDYPGPHLTVTEGERYAKVRREELQVPYLRYFGEGNPRGLGVGHLFTLQEFPRDTLNQEYLVIEARHDLASTQHELGGQGDHANYRFTSKLTAIPKTHAFRPARVSTKPLIRGPQTAIVAGPTSDEIYTDKYGRVKLKFHWDRENKGDEKASCWVRVASAWAGKQWGHIYLPRIGQEVIVEFLEGDPDRPIVTGRVYNADMMPPYALPANASKSTMKSMSTTKGTPETFNELRFDDAKDKEEIYFHAQKDFNRVVENNDTLKVGFQTKDKGNQTIDVYKDRTITIGNNDKITIGTGGGKDVGSQTITIYKDRTATLKTGSDTTTVKVDRTTTVQTGNDSLKISAGSQTTEAAQSITLKVGGNKIVIDQQGITLSGTMIKITAQTSLDASGLNTKVAGSLGLTLMGAMVKIN